MSNTEIIILALSMAFCWINFNRWLKFKPFNCMMCMTGWISLVLGLFLVQTHPGHNAIVHAIGLWFIGCYIGAIFEAIKMRWL